MVEAGGVGVAKTSVETVFDNAMFPTTGTAAITLDAINDVTEPVTLIPLPADVTFEARSKLQEPVTQTASLLDGVSIPSTVIVPKFAEVPQ